MENKITHEIHPIEAEGVVSDMQRQEKKTFKTNKLKSLIKKANFQNIPFDLESLVLYKKFLSNDNQNFFDKDLLNYFMNLSKNILRELESKFNSITDENKELIERVLLKILINTPIDKVFRIFLSLFLPQKNKIAKEDSHLISFLISESQLPVNVYNDKLIYFGNINKVSIEEINGYIKKAPFSHFKEIISVEAFLKEIRFIEPVLITIFNFAYFIMFFLLKLTDFPIISRIHPKPLKNKLLNLDALFVKFNKSKIENKHNSVSNEFKIICDFLKFSNQSINIEDVINTKEELSNQALNLINCLLIFFQRLPSKSKKLISGNQAILEILINLLVYKNYILI